jgi:hypothetical protein
MSKNTRSNLEFEATFDLKAEAFAAILLKKSENTGDSYDAEQVVVFPNGSVKRKSALEVVEVRRKEYESDFSLFMEVNKPGLFDALPQGLFIKTEEKFSSLLEKTSEINKQIKKTRKFLLPFDQSFYHPRIRMEQIEQKWNEHLPESLLRIWGLDKYQHILTDRQAYLLLYVIPAAPKAAGNFDLTRLIFTAVLGKNILIESVKPRKYKIQEIRESYHFATLGGEDALMGDCFQDDLPGLKVIIEGMNNEEVAEYMPFGKQRIILEEILYSFFIPLEYDVETVLNICEESRGIGLGTSYLGYGTDLVMIQNDISDLN